jgi:signal transduction histidine kinase
MGAGDVVTIFSQYAIAGLIAALVGINVGNRRRYLSAVLDRADRLVRERDQQAELAAAAERARVAREMHDIIAHSLSVVVTLADGAVASAANNPDSARQAMERVADTGRTALAEMRRLLGVLGPGGEEGDLQPQPGMDRLPELIENFRAAGLPIRVETIGTAPDDASVQLALYRIVQEALTNVLRYSGGPKKVDVQVRYGNDGSEVTVTDDGSTVTDYDGGAGRGIIGMRERASLFGGVAEAGPIRGGWRVHASIPARRDK